VIGTFPKVSLADTRQAARAKLRLAEAGCDPALDQKERETAGTFGELAELYMTRHANPAGASKDLTDTQTGAEKPRRARKGKKSWKEDRRILNNVLLSKDGANWRHVKVVDLTRPMIRTVFETISDRAPVMANRTLALISKILNFALARDWIDANPTALIQKNPETSRARVLNDNEIRELWAALGETARRSSDGRLVARLNATLNDAFRMRFYTGQRGGEVFMMRWSDIDLETGWWEIPGQFTKNGEIHRVPLVAAAVEMLRERQKVARPGAVWVFENVRASTIPGRQFGNVAARGKKAAAFLSSGEAHLTNKRARSRKRPPTLPGLSFQFQGHDIRRTVSTNMAKAGVRRDDVSKVLNHVDRGPRATKVYDRYEYDVEKRAALETWARRLETILEAR
jgi:integrase